MATRFYFPHNSTGNHPAPVTPSSWSAGWNKTTSTSSAALLNQKSTDELTVSVSLFTAASGTSGHFTAIARWVSAPLTPQTISGTVKGQFRCHEPSASDNFTLAVAIKVIQADGTDRGALLAVSASDDTSATPPEMVNTTSTNRSFNNSSESASLTLSSTAVSFGDRLVVEIGYRQASTSTSSGTIRARATAGGTDLAEDNSTTTDNVPWIEFSGDIGFANSYYNSAANPADSASATNTADPTAVTPPTGMTAGDLVVMVGHQRATGATLAVSAAGGQTWNSLTAIGTTNVTARVFWCQYNGTWSTDPSVDFSAATCNSVILHVFRPPSTSYTWSVNQTQVELDFSGTLSPTIAGQTTTGSDPTVTLAGWFTADDNTWGTISGAGWIDAGIAQYRNTSGSDQSATFAYKLQTAAGATGNVTKTQLTLGDDAGSSFIITFAATLSAAFNVKPTMFAVL
jgi:hypothetical protein